MDMTFTLPGGSGVDAHIGPFTVRTDQPPDATAPTPFALFLASVGACAAYYAQLFCRKRDISTAGLRVVQHNEMGPSGLVSRIALRLEVPADFPQQYRGAVLRAMDQCTVKKHLEHPPLIEVEMSTPQHEATVSR